MTDKVVNFLQIAEMNIKRLSSESLAFKNEYNAILQQEEDDTPEKRKELIEKLGEKVIKLVKEIDRANLTVKDSPAGSEVVLKTLEASANWQAELDQAEAEIDALTETTEERIERVAKRDKKKADIDKELTKLGEGIERFKSHRDRILDEFYPDLDKMFPKDVDEKGKPELLTAPPK